MSDPAGWTAVTTWSANGRAVTAGTELSIRGERGRFVFRRYVTTADGRAWIDVLGGKTDHEQWRSFRPERVRTVHRIAKTRKAKS